MEVSVKMAKVMSALEVLSRVPLASVVVVAVVVVGVVVTLVEVISTPVVVVVEASTLGVPITMVMATMAVATITMASRRPSADFGRHRQISSAKAPAQKLASSLTCIFFSAA